MSARHHSLPISLLRAAAVLCCVSALSACSSSMLGGSSKEDALKALKWTYGADGIQIDVRANPQLNLSEGQAHTLALTVVQFADPTVFTPYSSDSAKLTQLLLANSAPVGMLSLQRLFIAPGEQGSISVPRAENAKYVGLAAGYYHLDAPRNTRLYRIGVDIESSGFLIKNHNATPTPLKIDLLLGPNSILDAPDSRIPSITPTQPEAGLVPNKAATDSETTSSKK